MTEEQKQEEQPEVEVEKPTEEKINVNVDMSGVQNQIAELSKQIAEMLKVREQEPVEKPAEETADETKGEVVSDEEKEEPEVAEEGYVVEQAETGKGFSIWRDYSKTPGKFKRLAR